MNNKAFVDIMRGRHILIWVALVAIAMVYGYQLGKHQVFPYTQLSAAFHGAKQLWNGTAGQGRWAIGLYTGATPFAMQPASGVVNPVIDINHVEDKDDIVAVADPFLFIDQGKYYAFYEIYDDVNGTIGFSSSSDLINWSPTTEIIAESGVHFSYPLVFAWKGNRYLVPETHDDYSVRLYKATDFPARWERQSDLMSGYAFVDPTLFRHDELWWMFVGTGNNDVLNLFFADSLNGKWTAHPQNPIVKGDANKARPAGRILSDQGRLFRITQDDAPRYGLEVRAIEILELSTSVYREEQGLGKTIVKPANESWNQMGMHHADLHFIDGQWVALVDGKRYDD